MFRSSTNLGQSNRSRAVDVGEWRTIAPVFCVCMVGLLGIGCATPEKHTTPTAPQLEDMVVFHRAEADRGERLSLEISRLRDDLRRAEQALIEVESGLRGNLTRANAVSALAEARILSERASQQAPWRVNDILEAQNKLIEADAQIQKNNSGAALFFVYRARRIAELALLEAKAVRQAQDTYFVSQERVNLRAGPTTEDRVLAILTRATPVFGERSEGDWMLVRVVSGSAGWIHKSLLSTEQRGR